MKHPNAEIETLLESLAHTKIPVIDLSLDRIKIALEALGNPQKKLPPVVHAAGTNGKGSLLAYLRAMCEAAGYKVHRYTSPHLVRFNERILLAGNEIADEHLMELLKRVRPVFERHPVTAFEAITTLAYIAFSEIPADILLLETGMGGRLDATNVLDAPLLTAITPISMDHMDYLGDSLAAIAAEKAGILKAGVPCVVGPQKPEADNIIEHTANQLNVSLFRYKKEWSVEKSGDGMCWVSGKKEALFPLPRLAGRHQMYNAGTAMECVRHLQGFSISDEHIAVGITQAEWPARLQRLTEGALAELVPHGSELWLDGGHNAGAGQELALWLSKQVKPVHLICGMLNTKDTASFLAPMAPHLETLTGIAIDNEPLSHTAAWICQAAEGLAIPNTLGKSIKSVIEQIVKNNNSGIIILICGSLSLAGNTLWQNGT